MSDLSHWGSAISLLGTRLNRTSSYSQERAAGWPKVEVRRGRTSFWRSAIRMASSSKLSSVLPNHHYSCAYVWICVASCHEFLWETVWGWEDWFLLIASRVPDHGLLPLFLWAWGRAEHCGGGDCAVEGLLTSSQPGSKHSSPVFYLGPACEVLLPISRVVLIPLANPLWKCPNSVLY